MGALMKIIVQTPDKPADVAVWAEKYQPRGPALCRDLLWVGRKPLVFPRAGAWGETVHPRGAPDPRDLCPVGEGPCVEVGHRRPAGAEAAPAAEAAFAHPPQQDFREPGG